ncbi:MAG: hypothetical protein RJQ00_09190 [Vicingaceae bacterium]
MKRIILFSFLVLTAIALNAQSTLSITNNTSDTISFAAAQGMDYDCSSTAGGVMGNVIAAGESMSLEHTNGFKHWIGILITAPVNEAYPNYNAEKCGTKFFGTYRVDWESECTVSINRN